MNANPNIAARDQLRAAIAARAEAERETAEAKAAVERATEFVAGLEAKLSHAETSTANSASKLAQAFRSGQSAPLDMPASSRAELTDQLDVAKRALAELQSVHETAVERERRVAHAVARCARMVMAETGDAGLVAELESLHARRRAIETELNGLAECWARLPTEDTAGPFPMTQRALSALVPPSNDYLDRQMINPLAPRIEASAKWRQFFSALVESADAQFERDSGG